MQGATSSKANVGVSNCGVSFHHANSRKGSAHEINEFAGES
jgi:hypothetical protein